MELKLFKEPYIDSGAPKRIRLLFECVEATDADANSCDFYVYAWIENDERCTGFQIIADDEYVVEWHAANGPTFGRIRGKPLGRSIQDIGRDTLHDRIIETMQSVTSDYFQNLLGRIGERLVSENTEFINLVSEEIKYLKILIKNKSR
jgi:hypothetical protein